MNRYRFKVYMIASTQYNWFGMDFLAYKTPWLKVREPFYLNIGAHMCLAKLYIPSVSSYIFSSIYRIINPLFIVSLMPGRFFPMQNKVFDFCNNV